MWNGKRSKKKAKKKAKGIPGCHKRVGKGVNIMTEYLVGLVLGEETKVVTVGVHLGLQTAMRGV